MNQNQFEAMQTIMQCSRVFCDSMYRAMENAGLFDQGYQLGIKVEKFADSCTIKSMIELENNNLGIGTDIWKKNRMAQTNWAEWGWRVDDDPVAKEGTVPTMVGQKTAEDDRKAVGEKAVHPYPPDGLWLSSRDDSPVLDGGQ